MGKKYFGTDGIRGRVGDALITPEFVMRLGYAAGRVLTSLDSNLAKGAHPAVLIGKDTRISGYMLEAALEAGLSAAGVDVLLTGPMPTPRCWKCSAAGLKPSNSNSNGPRNSTKRIASCAKPR